VTKRGQSHWKKRTKPNAQSHQEPLIIAAAAPPFERNGCSEVGLAQQRNEQITRGPSRAATKIVTSARPGTSSGAGDLLTSGSRLKKGGVKDVKSPLGARK